jgi:hypothetical protein
VSKRSRLLAWLAGAALLVGAVIVMRVPVSERDETEARVDLRRFAADLVVLPGPSQPPPQPQRIAVEPASGRMRLSWADGLIGGEVLPGVVGYEVEWERLDGEGEPDSRLVVAPDMLLDGLVDGERYRVRVRSVDAYGQRSAPTEATGEPEDADAPPLLGLTRPYDDFTDQATIAPDSPASRWHVSSYRGCVDLGTGSEGLAIELSCGSDVAVMRARSPLLLGDGEVLGRVAVLTDTAGPGGELTVDLVPGPADRVGVGTQRASEARDGLPGGAIRVSISDGGVVVTAAPDVPVGPPTVEYQRVPRRGPGVPHLFEVALTSTGVRVYQDGQAVGLRKVLPTWRRASVLLGFRGPADRPARVHVSAVGLAGSSRVVGVVEAPVRLATKRVLAPGEAAPDIGVPREPLVAAKAARVVATLAVNPELDLSRAVVQLGAARVPARPAAHAPPRASGASVTLVATVPKGLLGPRGPATITPFVVRAPGSDTTATVVEAYLEITPTAAWRPAAPVPRQPAGRKPDAAPEVELAMTDAAGAPVRSRTLKAQGQVVLTVRLKGDGAQWDTGAVAGVRGLEVYLDANLIAGLPTEADGLGVGGVYALPMAVGGLSPGNHTLEVREYLADASERPQTARMTFEVER